MTNVDGLGANKKAAADGTILTVYDVSKDANGTITKGQGQNYTLGSMDACADADAKADDGGGGGGGGENSCWNGWCLLCPRFRSRCGSCRRSSLCSLILDNAASERRASLFGCCRMQDNKIYKKIALLS
jgi:hypothetical protein